MKTAEEAFKDELASLSSRVGERNRRLLTVALKGRAAGYPVEELTRRIVEASGTPPLSAAEVMRAVDKAWTVPERAPDPAPYRPEKRRGNQNLTRILRSLDPSRSAAVPGQSSALGFVREMIAEGGGEAKSAALVEASARPIRKDPTLQALDFCLALDEPDSGLFFTGEPTMKRTRDRLVELSALESDIVFGDLKALPTHILPNDLTGRAERNERGEESYALEKCLLYRRRAVVEFDALPLPAQAAFWLGVVRTGLLPVISLVYSGGKSIHGLLRLKDEVDFREQWRILERHLASDPDPAYRCDVACRNPGRLTRFPGAIRPDTHRRQTLLYLG